MLTCEERIRILTEGGRGEYFVSLKEGTLPTHVGGEFVVSNNPQGQQKPYGIRGYYLNQQYQDGFVLNIPPTNSPLRFSDSLVIGLSKIGDVPAKVERRITQTFRL